MKKKLTRFFKFFLLIFCFFSIVASPSFAYWDWKGYVYMCKSSSPSTQCVCPVSNTPPSSLPNVFYPLPNTSLILHKGDPETCSVYPNPSPRTSLTNQDGSYLIQGKENYSCGTYDIAGSTSFINPQDFSPPPSTNPNGYWFLCSWAGDYCSPKQCNQASNNCLSCESPINLNGTTIDQDAIKVANFIWIEPASSPSPSLSPSPSPSSSPQSLTCSSISRNPVASTVLKVNDTIVFTCAGQASQITINHYEFRLSKNNGTTWENLANANNDQTTDLYTITSPGNYLVQCRICTDSVKPGCQCTNWGAASGWGLNRACGPAPSLPGLFPSPSPSLSPS